MKQSESTQRDDFVILVAEDDEHDIIAIRRAWRTLGIPNPLIIVNDGEACLDYLFGRGEYATATLPGLLLLDLHMPRLDGMETLRAIRGNNATARLPVVILTTSKAEEDRLRSYDLGANAYIVKPVGFENFTAALRTIHEFWKLVERPEVLHVPR
jgi:CheY-like chemotaxis protein